MSDGKALVNLGDLSKPATVLIEKISNAIGVLYEPTRVRRAARAEADAKKISAIANIELNEIEDRAMHRVIHQESRRQENIENITATAIPDLSENANVQNLEEDWIAHFFKNCEDVSDQEMQSLWSRLLVGEANKPGTFSKRTVDFVATLDKKDAQVFTALCQFCWFQGRPLPLIYSHDDEIYAKAGISFSSLQHMSEIGLLTFNSITGFQLKTKAKKIVVFYFGKPTEIEFSKDTDNSLPAGQVLLSRVGEELASICGAQPNNEFYLHIIERWYKEGLVVSSPIRR